MKYKNLHFIKFFFVMILLVIFLAVLILGFCWFFYLLPIDFPGTVGDWIAGLSALAGGALTLGGVWWTIKDNNKQKKDELRIQYKPVITTEEILIRFDRSHRLKSLTIKNEGRGEFYIDKIFSSNNNISFVKNFDPVNILQADKKIIWSLFCDINNSFPDKIKQGEIILFTISGRNLLNEKIIVKFYYKV